MQRDPLVQKQTSRHEGEGGDGKSSSRGRTAFNSSLLVSLLAVAWLTAAAAPSSAQAPQKQPLRPLPPPRDEPNPYLAFLPSDATPSWDSWRQLLTERATRRRLERRAFPVPRLVFTEAEPVGVRGENDHPLFGEALDGFGTLSPQTPAATISGSILPPFRVRGPFGEPDGAIPEASSLEPPELAPGQRYVTAGFIGDGAYGSGAGGSGDFDFYAFDVDEFQRLDVQVRTPQPFQDLDPILAVYDSGGSLVAFNDDLVRDGFLVSLDSALSVVLERAGRYYIVVGGSSDPLQQSQLPEDPFDPASGDGAGSEGSYELQVALDSTLFADVDVFTLELRAGDVLGLVARGGPGRIALSNVEADVLVGSRLDLSSIYSQDSPLPGGGDAVAAYVIEQPGTYAVIASDPAPFEEGTYEIEIEVFRPPLEDGTEFQRQILFVDFDGATVDRGRLTRGPFDPVDLSPLSAFLQRWNLRPEDENALIDAILRVVTENLSQDVRDRGGNGDFRATGIVGQFDIELTNSRDHPDPAGEPATSRIVVGGTTQELGLRTIGIAESVDVGNFTSAEIAVVLLDLLSAGDEDPNSINAVELADGAGKIELVATAVGSIVAHEAGHLFGNFHTERDTGPANIMDRGGRLLALLGVGEDGVFGSPDDLDVDLGPDSYESAEGFDGVEDTLNVVSFDLPTGGERTAFASTPQTLDFGSVPVGTTRTETLTLTNPGSRSLTIRSLTLGGPNPGPFTLPSPAVAPLAPGGARELEVRFAPVAPERSQAILTVESDDPAQPLSLIPLSGQGGAGAVVFDVASHDFGSLEYGDVSISSTTTFEVRNLGPGPLAVQGAGFIGPHPRRFTVDDGATGSVAPGEVHPVTVSFRPAGAVRDSRATLQIATNDTVRPRLDVELRGRSEGPDLRLTPSRSFFVGAPLVGAERRRDFFLANKGTRLLAIAPIVMENGQEDHFRIEGEAGPFAVLPGDEARVRVVYSPLSTGLHRAEMPVLSNDPDEPSIVVELQGLGTQAHIQVNPEAIAFGPITGDSAVLEILNTGDGTLSGSATLEGDSPEVFEIVGPDTFHLPGDTRVVLQVVFTPPSASPRQGWSAVVRIASNDPDQPILDVPLTGGLPAAIPSLSQAGVATMVLLLIGAGVLCLRRTWL